MISRDGVTVVFSVFLFDYYSYHMLTEYFNTCHKYIFSYAQALSFSINVCTHTHTHTHTVQATKLTKMSVTHYLHMILSSSVGLSQAHKFTEAFCGMFFIQLFKCLRLFFFFKSLLLAKAKCI